MDTTQTVPMDGTFGGAMRAADLVEKRAVELDAARDRVRAFLDAYEAVVVGSGAIGGVRAEDGTHLTLTVSDLRTVLAGEP